MNQKANHKGSLDKTKLQRSLRLGEANLCKIISIEIVGTETISTHDFDTEVPDNSLVLVEDNDAGTVTAPEGCEASAFCKGKALIGGNEKKVALFRKKPA